MHSEAINSASTTPAITAAVRCPHPLSRLYVERLRLGGVVPLILEAGETTPPNVGAVVCSAESRAQLTRLVRSERACIEAPIVALAPAGEAPDTLGLVEAGATLVLVCAGGYLDQLVPVVLSAAAAHAERAASQAAMERMHAALAGIRDENQRLHELIGRLESLAMTDALTGLGNRRAIESQVRGLFAGAARHATDLSCLMVDVDRLKSVNDALGHAAGDDLILAAARALRDECRKSDVCGRLGGDEFAVLLPQTPVHAARRLAERVQRRFAALAQPVMSRLGGASGAVSLSIGIASTGDSTVEDEAALLNAADAALYAAKRAGRGTVMIQGDGRGRAARAA